jgi:hypothetical protein
MLAYYKYSRKDIVEEIRKSPKTDDGYYICKKFQIMNSEVIHPEGNKGSYYYPREIFADKLCFNEEEIDMYLTTYPNENFNYKKMQQRDTRLMEIIDKLIVYDINEKIPDVEYNLGELIDTFIYIYNIKN